jgi:hypothetical protein
VTRTCTLWTGVTPARLSWMRDAVRALPSTAEPVRFQEGPPFGPRRGHLSGPKRGVSSRLGEEL